MLGSVHVHRCISFLYNIPDVGTCIYSFFSKQINKRMNVSFEWFVEHTCHYNAFAFLLNFKGNGYFGIMKDNIQSCVSKHDFFQWCLR